jgi:putative ABC transport system ATP-binding protein
MENIVELKAVSKSFRTEEVETSALDAIDLSIKKGEFTAIMGPSGCGKSTLLNIIGLLDSPDKGTYLLDGKDVSQLKEKQRTAMRKGKIGFVFQSFNLIDELTVYENIEMPLKYLRIGASERKAKIEAVLERMKIGHRKKHFPQQLSGGQQQRVALCRAIVAEPSLILADEPTGNLDSKHGQEVMKLLLELNRGGTSILMVTHAEYDASFAHRVVHLFDGKVITEAEKRKLELQVEPTQL